MSQNLSAPPIPTRSPIVDPKEGTGLVSRPWIAWFTWLNGLFASINSPSFTGQPTVPTADPGTDNTQVANTAFVTAAVEVETLRAETAESSLSDSITAEQTRAIAAENSLNTLKAPKASPVFTGTVTQPESSVLTAATTASSATAGGASALPGTPAGYLSTSINGVNVLIPYYAI